MYSFAFCTIISQDGYLKRCLNLQMTINTKIKQKYLESIKCTNFENQLN